MSEERESRLAAARRQVRTARLAIAALAVAAFGGAAVAAESSHPATVQPASSDTSLVQSDDEDSSQSFDFGTSAIAPAGGATSSFRSRSS